MFIDIMGINYEFLIFYFIFFGFYKDKMKNWAGKIVVNKNRTYSNTSGLVK